ncbi:hypothetical protein KIPE111705_23115 [Kibdelosporangium persicum]|uniref:Secreted protein n=2 Tax=Kibdelosporangium persicum TaxID=2698649 RepID=A0ABX2FJN3_9PSEU|nr:hypothetical protein [Kibdelosporangium persicum]
MGGNRVRAVLTTIAVAAGVAVSMQAAAHADSGQYAYVNRSGGVGGNLYAWYRDLPPAFHDNLTRFTNRTDRDMCVAYWDRGTLYSMQTVPPGQAQNTVDSYLPDAIVDCRYFLA